MEQVTLQIMQTPMEITLGGRMMKIQRWKRACINQNIAPQIYNKMFQVKRSVVGGDEREAINNKPKKIYHLLQNKLIEAHRIMSKHQVSTMKSTQCALMNGH
eukprot:scaffold39068_cov189-Skeletonema_dohrnii-CCMP3373.AAC.1